MTCNCFLHPIFIANTVNDVLLKLKVPVMVCKSNVPSVKPLPAREERRMIMRFLLKAYYRH